jgi:hypothetical protein
MGLFKDALTFPFKPFKRLWWFWINGVPVLGWIVYAGYGADIFRHIIKKEEDNMPPMGRLWPTAKTGFFFLLLSAIIGTVGDLFLWIPYAGWFLWFVVLLLMPILLIQYSLSREFIDGLDVISASKMVFRHFFKYIWYNIAIIIITFIWALATLPIVTVLIALPALMLSSGYLLARFYREVQPKDHLYTHHNHKKH